MATGGIIYYNKTKNADLSVEIAQEKQVENTNEITEENTIEIENVVEDTEETEIVEDNTEQVAQTETTVEEQTQQTEQVTKTPKQETQITTQTQSKQETTSSDLEYWCISGGSHHVAGDGANEHGYYQTWNQAQNALDEYVNGLDSIQYKISQCSCGLYYFWVIEN